MITVDQRTAPMGSGRGRYLPRVSFGLQFLCDDVADERHFGFAVGFAIGGVSAGSGEGEPTQGGRKKEAAFHR